MDHLRDLAGCQFYIEFVITELAAKYKLDRGAVSVAGIGGGGAALIGFCSDKMNLRYSIPENAEVISSIGVDLALIRDVVERVVPNPIPEDIRSIRAEALDKAVESAAASETVEVHIEIDPQTSKLSAIALGSTEVKTAELLKEATPEESLRLAPDDLKIPSDETVLLCSTAHFRVYGTKSAQRGKNPVRILDKKGFIKAQRVDGVATKTQSGACRAVTTGLWDELALYKADAILRPDYYICVGSRAMDYAGTVDIERILMLMETDMQSTGSDDEIIIVGARNSL
ncbi:MAG: hypothetical protein LBL45_08785 [Treponema sp.]|jgi:hypothetical protein|nr:hypothetical protein [Treponema sp.]